MKKKYYITLAAAGVGALGTIIAAFISSYQNNIISDGVTGNQLEFKNVIILATSISTRSDGKLMDIGLESGNGYYVSMGKAQPITWSKDSDDSPIKLYDESGNEISINAGKSYIGFISENNISIEIFLTIDK